MNGNSISAAVEAVKKFGGSLPSCSHDLEARNIEATHRVGLEEAVKAGKLVLSTPESNGTGLFCYELPKH